MSSERESTTFRYKNYLTYVQEVCKPGEFNMAFVM